MSVAQSFSVSMVDRVPVEIWGKIAQALSAPSLFNFVLSSRKIYKATNHHLYRSVYYFGTVRSDKRAARAYSNPPGWIFGAHRTESRLSYSSYSSSINHLKAFLRTMTTVPELRSRILGASFKWDDTATAETVLLSKKCLQVLNASLSLLHLGLPDFDTRFAITTNVTFLEIVYPDEKWLSDDYLGNKHNVPLHEGLRDLVYSLFSIPNLQHLSLRKARTWKAFLPHFPRDNSKAGTSNISTLMLPETVPLSRDLREILTWPKALKRIYHETTTGKHGWFQNHNSEETASAKRFIEGLRSQRRTLEELVFVNSEDRTGNDETTFGTAMREFVGLRRLAVFIGELHAATDKDALPLYETLPPNLEEVWMELDSEDIYGDEEQLHLKQELRELARKKEQYFPSLRKVVLWIGDLDLEAEDALEQKGHGYQAEARTFLAALDLVSMFQKFGIRLEFMFGHPTSFEISEFISLERHSSG